LTHNVYYIKELDVIAIADFKAHVLHLKGVFCENEVLLDDVISTLSNKKISKVVLDFTPKDKYPYNENILVSEDVLFILDDKWDLFDDGKLQFPILSYA
jgi:hypothetical protein